MTTPDKALRRSFLLAGLFAILLVIMSGGLGIYVLSDPAVQQALSLVSVAFQIDKMYGDDVDWDRLIAGAQQEMFAQLDRYSSFYNDRDFEELDEELSGSYSGIGVMVVNNGDGLLIVSVRENGPAAEVGLLAGDKITIADSVALAGLTSERATRLLRGEEKSAVRLTIFRPATEETFEVSVERRKIPLLHLAFAGYSEDSILYFRLLDFEAGASAELRAALDSLLGQPPFAARGIILDLSGNPGGLFSEALGTAELFLEKGTLIVGTDGRSRWQDQKFFADKGDVTKGLPLVVMVDRGSASSAEIVAGALRSSGRAKLVGDTTFGKGLVQGFVQFPDGDGVKLTISRYYFEGGVYLNDFDSTLNDIGHGLVPDFYFSETILSPVVRELETSLLLSQFSALHQDAIIEAYDGDSLNNEWVQRVYDYAVEKNLGVELPLTSAIQDVKFAALYEKSSPAVLFQLERVSDLLKQAARQRFLQFSDYIKLRLAETAFERKHGTYKAYKTVLLKHRPDIAFARAVLKDSLK